MDDPAKDLKINLGFILPDLSHIFLFKFKQDLKVKKAVKNS